MRSTWTSLAVVETGADEHATAHVAFDPEDFDAAIAELDARYLTGEAAAHAETWSVIMRAFSALNDRELRELPPTTPDYRIIDHRLRATFGADELVALFNTTWNLTPELVMYVEAVHRLDDFGAVIAQASYGTSEEGFDAQWRMIQLLTVEGARGKHCEIFEEADLAGALARFDELHPHTRQLENAASRWLGRYLPHFTTRDWDQVAAMLAEDICTDDRRRTVNAGVFQGRDVELANLHAVADVGVEAISSTAVATRGERLILNRTRFVIPDWSEELSHEVIDIVEIDAHNRGVWHAIFDPDDVDAAIAELDARYLAGEAAAHSQTWSALTHCFASINRRELPETTPDWVNVDHRRSASAETGELAAFLSTTWDQTPELTNYVEAVHRLSDTAVVITYAARGTSQEGFDAEWRVVNLFTFEGEQVSRVELFDESDLEKALAKFDELTPPTQRLENAATRVADRYASSFTSRDWAAMAELITEDFSIEDRRPTVNAGIRHGRDAGIKEHASGR